MVIYRVGDTIEKATIDHNSKLMNFLTTCREKGVKLNTRKLELCCTEIPFMGHLVTSERLKADPDKIDTIVNTPKPTDVKDVQRLCGCTKIHAKPNMVGKRIREVIKMKKIFLFFIFIFTC